MKFLIWSISLLCVIMLFFFNFITKAQSLGSLKNKYDYIGISNSDFNSLAIYGKQRNQNWCWAACIQMVFNYHNIPITQEQIVKKAIGKLVNRPVSPSLIFKALNGWEVNAYGKIAKINSNIYPTSSEEIRSFLKTKNPLIVGLSQQQGVVGHAYVLIGLFYEVSDGNSIVQLYKPHSVILVDPWPGNPSIKDISWAEFSERLIVCFKLWIN